jgi:hypothetical protein
MPTVQVSITSLFPHYRSFLRLKGLPTLGSSSTCSQPSMCLG